MQAGRFSTVTIAIACTAFGATGCSDDAASGPNDPVAATVQRLQTAFSDGDAATICDRMTRPAQKQAGDVAHGDPTTCERDVRRAFRIIQNGGGWGQTGKPVVTRVSARERRATARLLHEEEWAADVPLTNDQGAWKLAGFFGVAPAKFKRIEATSEARPFPPASGRRIEVIDGSGERCPAISDRRYPEISGGCTFKVRAKLVPIRMLTPFGDFTFSDCDVSYLVRVDGEGRTWSDEWVFEHENQRGCSDLNACITVGSYRPWKGRLVSDGAGGYLHHMDMCLKTCIGLFAGDFIMRLARDDKGWSVEPTDQGATGFKIDGELAVAGKPFDIRDG